MGKRAFGERKGKGKGEMNWREEGRRFGNGNWGEKGKGFGESSTGTGRVEQS